MSALFRVGVLASGTGTNLQAILDQLHGATGSRSSGSARTSRRRRRSSAPPAAGVATETFPIERLPGPRGPRPRDRRLARPARTSTWSSSPATCSCSAPSSSGASPNRIVNVHPALLPSFPGLDAIGQALEHGVRVTGVTVHFVDEGVDTGPIILQRPVPVPPDRDREALEAAIHATEHALLPEAIRLIAAGRVQHRRVRSRGGLGSSP